MRSLTGRHIACMIFDDFKIRGDNEAILDIRDLSNVPIKNDSVLAFDAKCDEVLSAVTDRPSDNMYKMQVEKSDELKYVLQVYAQETTFGDKNDDCRLKLMAQRLLEVNSQQEIETMTDLQLELRAMEKRKGKVKTMTKTSPREETARVGSREANVHLEIRAHSCMNQTERQRKGTTSFTFSMRFTAPKFERWWKRCWLRRRKRHAKTYDNFSNDCNHKCVLKRRKLRPALGVIQTGEDNQRNPNAPTFEKIHRADFAQGRNGKDISVDTRTCAQVQVRIWDKTVPRAMFLHFQWEP